MSSGSGAKCAAHQWAISMAAPHGTTAVALVSMLVGDAWTDRSSGRWRTAAGIRSWARRLHRSCRTITRALHRLARAGILAVIPGTGRTQTAIEIMAPPYAQPCPPRVDNRVYPGWTSVSTPYKEDSTEQVRTTTPPQSVDVRRSAVGPRGEADGGGGSRGNGMGGGERRMSTPSECRTDNGPCAASDGSEEESLREEEAMQALASIDRDRRPSRWVSRSLVRKHWVTAHAVRAAVAASRQDGIRKPAGMIVAILRDGPRTSETLEEFGRRMVRQPAAREPVPEAPRPIESISPESAESALDALPSWMRHRCRAVLERMEGSGPT